jgi:hypothetical protein
MATPVLRRLVAMLAMPAMIACAACTPAAAPEEPSIAQVHARQCGRCHTAPAPGSRSRTELTEALSRHRKRVHLSSDEWHAMIDYLAASGAATSPEAPGPSAPAAPDTAPPRAPATK